MFVSDLFFYVFLQTAKVWGPKKRKGVFLQSRLIPPGARSHSRYCFPSTWAVKAGSASERFVLSWKQRKQWRQHSVGQTRKFRFKMCIIPKIYSKRWKAVTKSLRSVLIQPLSLCRTISPLCRSGSLDGSVWGWRAAAVEVWSQHFSLWDQRARWDSYCHTEVCEEACGTNKTFFKLYFFLLKETCFCLV